MVIKTLKINLYYVFILDFVLVAITSLAWAFFENMRANEPATKNAINNRLGQVDAKTRLEDHGITPLTPAQGNQSQTKAYKVGVAVEETDIADISSENHLSAFNRQASR